MNRLTVACAAALTVAVLAIAAPHPARAGSGDVAAGLLGGFAVGAFVGSVLGAPPVYVAPPPPVYVAPAPVYAGPPACYWTRGRAVWDGYRWVRPRIQVCD
ncbi:MAG: hypothetical protein AB7U62_09810 [Pseudolabrys sp.]